MVFFSFIFYNYLDIAAKLNLGWDAKWFWYIKSLYFFQNYNFSYLSQYEFNSFHPHFGSYLWAFFRELSFGKFEYSGRIFYAFLYLASLFFLIDKFEKNKIQNSIITFLLLLITYQYKLFRVYKILIFSLLVIKTKFIYEYINQKKIHTYFYTSMYEPCAVDQSRGDSIFMIILVALNFIRILSLIKDYYLSFKLWFNFI